MSPQGWTAIAVAAPACWWNLAWAEPSTATTTEPLDVATTILSLAHAPSSTAPAPKLLLVVKALFFRSYTPTAPSESPHRKKSPVESTARDLAPVNCESMSALISYEATASPVAQSSGTGRLRRVADSLCWVSSILSKTAADKPWPSTCIASPLEAPLLALTVTRDSASRASSLSFCRRAITRWAESL
jgi:hypothetical protein